MAIMEKRRGQDPVRDYLDIILDDADVAALAAGHPVEVRVGLPLTRTVEDSTFTLFRKSST